MTLFTEKERSELRLKLIKLMEAFLDRETIEDNNFGFLPTEVETMMANAALNILEVVNATSYYFEENNLLKD